MPYSGRSGHFRADIGTKCRIQVHSNIPSLFLHQSDPGTLYRIIGRMYNYIFSGGGVLFSFLKIIYMKIFLIFSGMYCIVYISGDNKGIYRK